MTKFKSLEPSESQIQSAAMQQFAILALSDPRYESIYAVPNGGYELDPRVGARLKREGLKKGVYDLVVDIPKHGAHGLRIEVKKPKGKISEEQEQWERRALVNGYHHAYCISTDQIVDLVAAYFAQFPAKLYNMLDELMVGAAKMRPRPKRLRLLKSR